jgi:hypothetical protein
MSVLSTLHILYPVPNGHTGRHAEPGFSQTIVGHNCTWVHFECWCNKSSVPVDERLPASELVICVCAASHLGTASGMMARNNIAGVQACHIAIGTPWHNGPRLKPMLKGIKCVQPALSR